ncbi:MAG: site-specific integrase [Gemmataceae bacterium]|nr:site-specific integrase [Gemmataceae bacterium]
MRRLNPDEPEDSDAFRAGNVLLAAHIAGCRDLPFLARLSGVPLAAVERFAVNLLAAGTWRPDGATAYRWVTAGEDGQRVVRSAPFLDLPVAEQNHDTGFCSDVITAVGGPRRKTTAPPAAARDPRDMIPAAVRWAGPEAERKFLEHFAGSDPRPQLPPAIRRAGPKAERTFIEFVVDPARSIGTRLADLRAAREFFAWLDARGLRLEEVRPPDVAAWAEDLASGREALSVRHALSAVRKLFDRLVAGGVLETNPAAASAEGTSDGPAAPEDREPPSELEAHVEAAVEVARRELRRHNPNEPEDSHAFRAGLVLLAAYAAGGHYDLPLLARVTGVPLEAVEWFAGNLVAEGTWRVDGTTAYGWAGTNEDGQPVIRSAPYLDRSVAEENQDTDFCSDVITAVGDWYFADGVIL